MSWIAVRPRASLYLLDCLERGLQYNTDQLMSLLRVLADLPHMFSPAREDRHDGPAAQGVVPPLDGVLPAVPVGTSWALPGLAPGSHVEDVSSLIGWLTVNFTSRQPPKRFSQASLKLPSRRQDRALRELPASTTLSRWRRPFWKR